MKLEWPSALLPKCFTGGFGTPRYASDGAGSAKKRRAFAKDGLEETWQRYKRHASFDESIPSADQAQSRRIIHPCRTRAASFGEGKSAEPQQQLTVWCTSARENLAKYRFEVLIPLLNRHPETINRPTAPQPLAKGACRRLGITTRTSSDPKI